MRQACVAFWLMVVLLVAPGAVAQTAIPAPGTVFRDCPECPEMVVIPAGKFDMGSTGGDRDETPVHAVAIAKPLAVGKHEVTFAEWDACVAAGGCRPQPEDLGWGRGRRPVMHVSWNDTEAYLAWLSRRTGKRYRLLSEAEWEYAATAGQASGSVGGEEALGDKNLANCHLCGSQWDGEQTAPVGSFPANRFGLHDMLGNVWEWVGDCWNPSYRGAPEDGQAWTAGDCAIRVRRGGSWSSAVEDVRAAGRGADRAGNHDGDTGFRVARPL
jgi:formylglycine-generating enzyme required for sulfatase activity